ncbi:MULTISPECIES: aldo/keto reductase [Salinivibrio]|uniref:Oxidoreductase n=1 Tax=Salinivibrio kushneri TaxID=1908198 RepID=A0AB36K7F9_9GAMM|nr:MULTISPECIES: aldo/keto reductase family oxidoreductase [Salinivibrio]OOE44415.1 oxidoreductase [Salinivibrio kushneri]OOE47599.1 oxidoreductase [Salinivibrio kushneri]OOE52203.1 oxidoreductase [Salinivibrio kushneri]OOE58368.1 oxidoreductase [Salinivibrio sp. ML323]OOE71771.1 oxidoreductase [Salinivibrio kushneri]
MVQGYWRLDDWQMTPQQRLSFLKAHIDLGITTVDHADIYGDYRCETLFGQALKLDPSVRDDIQVVSKCDINLVSEAAPNRKINHYDTSYRHILASVDNSLSRLGVEKLDVLLLHRPDALMDADEVAEAFTTLRHHGKVAHFGVSNFTPSQFDLLQSRWDESLVTNQVEINPLRFDVVHDGTLDQLQRLRIKPMAWSCLAGGEMFNGESEQAVRVRDTLHAIGEELGGATIDQVIYAWVMRHPSQPLPIIGSGNIERVKAAKAAYDLNLTREQWYRIWVASKGHNVP